MVLTRQDPDRAAAAGSVGLEAHRAGGEGGAVGFKANGAGGGGTVTILAGQDQTHLVRRAVVGLGMTILPSQIDTTGLQVWEVDQATAPS